MGQRERTEGSKVPKTTEPPVIWHAFHCDPVHEVVLVSRDKVHFRASAFRLGRVSGVFAEGQDQKAAIERCASYSSAIFELFLDLTLDRVPAVDRPEIDSQTLSSLLFCLSETRSAALVETLLSRDDVGWEDISKVLAFAETTDSVSFAAAGLKVVGQMVSASETSRAEHIKWILGHFRTSWREAIYDILLINVSTEAGQEVQVRKDWKAVSKEFEKKRMAAFARGRNAKKLRRKEGLCKEDESKSTELEAAEGSELVVE